MQYHGGRYHGFQVQPDAPLCRTVQGELLAAFDRLVGPSGHNGITAASRTDAGVHAFQNVGGVSPSLPHTESCGCIVWLLLQFTL